MYQKPKLSLEQFEAAIDSLRTHMRKVFAKHDAKPDGNQAHVSWHETLGDIEEEKYELLKSIHENSESRLDELHDVALSAVWGIASVKAGYNKT